MMRAKGQAAEGTKWAAAWVSPSWEGRRRQGSPLCQAAGLAERGGEAVGPTPLLPKVHSRGINVHGEEREARAGQ